MGAKIDRLRVKYNMTWHVLFDNETKNKPLTKLKLMKARYLPKEFSTPVIINIYRDRVVNVLWKKDYPMCFMVKNQDIADAYRKWFELLWKNAEF